MRSWPRWIATCIMSLGLVADAPAQTTKAATDSALVGCYALTVGAWSSPIAWDGFTLPPMFRLDAARSASPGSAGVSTWHTMGPTAMSGRWGMVSADLMKIYWYQGRAGDVLDLAVKGDTLRGQVQANSDIIDPSQTPPRATVTGIRTKCSPALGEPIR